MDLKQISDIIFKLYLYADNAKKIHYTTQSNHAHELCDQVRDSIVDFTDSFAEQLFGYYGKPSYSDFSKLNKLNINETQDIGQLCGYVSDMVEYVRSLFEKETKLSNIVSIIDDFKGDLSKYIFLASFDKVSNYKLKK